jgi:hypothetical protein
MRRTNKSGGRQPAVCGRSNDVRDFSQITCKCVPPHTTVRSAQNTTVQTPRAARVFDRLIAPRPHTTAMRRISAFRVRIECTPRGAYAPRSSVAVRIRHLGCTNACPQERRASARRGVCKPASAIAMRRISAFRVRIECTPRGAYAPRSSVAVRMSADEKPIFAMYIRMPTRAAGVSPPWSVNRTRCGENRPPFDDDATDEQERRA